MDLTNTDRHLEAPRVGCNCYTLPIENKFGGTKNIGIALSVKFVLCPSAQMPGIFFSLNWDHDNSHNCYIHDPRVRHWHLTQSQGQSAHIAKNCVDQDNFLL